MFFFPKYFVILILLIFLFAPIIFLFFHEYKIHPSTFTSESLMISIALEYIDASKWLICLIFRIGCMWKKQCDYLLLRFWPWTTINFNRDNLLFMSRANYCTQQRLDTCIEWTTLEMKITMQPEMNWNRHNSSANHSTKFVNYQARGHKCINFGWRP